MRITLDVAGDKQLERELLRISHDAVDATPAFDAIATFLIGETKQQFDSEGLHASGGWKPLKPATVTEKRRKGLDPRILHATLALERSLTQRGDPSMVLETGPDELTYGSRLPYAGVHQNPRVTNPLPRRRPVELTEAARRQVVKTLQRFLLTGEVAP